MPSLRKETLADVLTIRIPSRVSTVILSAVARTKRRRADVARDALACGLGLSVEASQGKSQKESSHVRATA